MLCFTGILGVWPATCIKRAKPQPHFNLAQQKTTKTSMGGGEVCCDEGSETRKCSCNTSWLHISDKVSAFPAREQKHPKKCKNTVTVSQPVTGPPKLPPAASALPWQYGHGSTPALVAMGFHFFPPNYDVRGACMLSNCYKEACRK